MKFVCFLRARGGKTEELLKKIQEVGLSTEYITTEIMGLFGEYDAMIIFEAIDEVSGAEFVFQFQELAETKTLVGVSLERLFRLEGG
jgi:uncharacterized protein with GYD domain